MSQRAWRRAETWQKDSAIAGVTAALEGATPEELHEAWCDHKRAEGWTHGAEKDAEAKTHPALLPYNGLPPVQVAKDHLFGAIIGALAPFFGWEQTRTSVHLSSAEIEMTRDAGNAGFVKDGIRVVLA